MSAVLETLPTPAPPVAPPTAPRRRVPFRALAPTLFTLANAIAFYFLRPDVNDLWAARARANAAHDGVGLFYWFGWFGGGATPGSYSVGTPYLSSLIGTELLGALSAIAATALVTVLVRDTAHPHAAAAAGAFGASVNLWSGRIPFLLGSAIAVGAVIAVRRRRTLAAAALTVLSMAASPVSGAFVAVGLSGTFLATRTKDYRRIIAVVVVSAVLAVIVTVVLFGAAPPEPFRFWLLASLVAGLLIMLFAAQPPDNIRDTIWVSLLACFVLFVIPNALGSNFERFACACLPVAVIALSTERWWRIALAVLPLMILGAEGTIVDLHNAGRPESSAAYYRPLASELDRIPDLHDYRLEVVEHGSHAGYDALLGHAVLARGWETQEDNALDKALQQDPLSPVTYRAWLSNNAVGYLALPDATTGDTSSPEYRLVAQQRPGYLKRVWQGPHWQLFRVAHATPIVAPPERLLSLNQADLSVSVPCACTFPVRVRYSTHLVAQTAAGAQADLVDDGYGWTVVTTPVPGQYVFTGSIGG